MAINFQTFLGQLADVVENENNGPHLAYLLKPTSPHGKDLVKEFRNPTRATMKYYEGSLVSPWDEIAIQYVLVVSHVAKSRYAEAFKEHSQLISQFFRYFTANSGWTLPALFSMLRDLRDLAFDADNEARSQGQKTEVVEESARIIAKAFGNCITDRVSTPNESRKWGVYYVVGLVLKAYFKVKKISLSKNILRALEANDIPPLASYPRSHQVTYRYYIGMLSFLNEDYTTAEKELTGAFYNCHVVHQTNQQRILTYLVPLRILRGHLPSPVLLNRFPTLAELYTPFIEAIRTGDIAAYDRELERCEAKLSRLSVVFTMEKARELCLRGLFRRVWVASGKGTRIPLPLFHSALKLSGIELDQDEAECLVANMIYKGFMKGYISHSHAIVVLSGNNSFPRLTDRQSPLSFI